MDYCDLDAAWYAVVSADEVQTVATAANRRHESRGPSARIAATVTTQIYQESRARWTAGSIGARHFALLITLVKASYCITAHDIPAHLHAAYLMAIADNVADDLESATDRLHPAIAAHVGESCVDAHHTAVTVAIYAQDPRRELAAMHRANGQHPSHIDSAGLTSLTASAARAA